MSLTLTESGTREGVMKHLSELAAPDKPHGTDAAQVEAIKEVARREIEALGESATGVRIDIHATASASMRQIHVSVIPLNVRT